MWCCWICPTHNQTEPIVCGRVCVDTFSQLARTVGGDFGVVWPFFRMDILALV